MAEIVLQDLVKRFGDTVAVKDLNLTIRDKEFLVLLGPSGCGKRSPPPARSSSTGRT